LDAIKKLLCKRSLYLAMSHTHYLVGRFRLAAKGWRLRSLSFFVQSAMGGLIFELLELIELGEKFVIDSGRA